MEAETHIAAKVGAALERVLRELLMAGYEGSGLLEAFARHQAIISTVAAPVSTAAGISTKSDIKSDNNPATKSATPARPRAIAYAPPDNAKAIGRKALASSGLASSVIGVGSQLIEHYNLKTGRCDPGCTGIAAKLGLSLRTVQRAIQGLVEAGLFTVGQNAGQGHRNAYFPVWPRLVEMADAVTASPPVLSQTPDNSVDQNHRTKPALPTVVVKAKRVKPPDPRQRQFALMRSVPGGKASQPIAEAAREAVRKRLFAELHAALSSQFLPDDKASFVTVMSRGAGVDWAPIVAAEMAHKGNGLPLLLDAIGIDQGREVAAG